MIFKFIPDIKPGVYEKLKQRVINHWKLYEEPQLDDQGNLIKKLVPEKQESLPKVEKKVKEGNGSSDDSDANEGLDQDEGDASDVDEERDAKLAMDLPETCLKVNLGIPIMIVVQKVDALLHGEKRQYLD